MNDYRIKTKQKSNNNGPHLVCAESSGVDFIEKDGLYFKDLARDGKLHPFQDWRLSPNERAKDLAAKLSIDQILGLMLYSKHQMVPNFDSPYFGKATYNTKPYQESGLPAYVPTDQQQKFIREDFVRHILVGSVSSSTDAAEWSNQLQAIAENESFGIPIQLCSDPRHGCVSSAEFNVGADNGTSKWPEGIGMAATFEPLIAKRHGEIAAKEYRAMGMTTTLSPQCDLSTDPRWGRFGFTFGEHAMLSADMTRAYCDGFQTTNGKNEIELGWGYDSVNTMVKHWPGGGTGEGGRDAHFPYGKYAVYPGNNFEYHLTPFVEGAFKLEGPTAKASAVMPYYTISTNQDKENGENVGNSFSRYIVSSLLREKYGYDGVVCTDWSIVFDETETFDISSGKCWGVEHLDIGERCLLVIMAGIDQIGGLSDKEPLMHGYELGVEKYGVAYMRQRLEESARRILRNIFQVGLFENPYLNVEQSTEIVGCDEFMQAGYEAQLKSIVLLKNVKKTLPLKPKTKVYVPELFTPSHINWIGIPVEENQSLPINKTMFSEYFTFVDSCDDADVAICFPRTPGDTNFAAGYDHVDKEHGGNGYIPISLQYRPYTATSARTKSLAGGDPFEYSSNRSYRGKTASFEFETDLDIVIETKKKMGSKPVIVVLNLTKPMIMNEIEKFCDAIVVCFGSMEKAVYEIICGNVEPSGLLPLQFPANMETVEKQQEDVPFDLECHIDTEGNIYDFAFGLNWSGVINDARVIRYTKTNSSL